MVEGDSGWSRVPFLKLKTMILQFSDGVTIDTSGPYRTLHLSDEWYVIGQGQCIPMSNAQEASDFVKLRQSNELTYAGWKPSN